jgi:hypothetical protein
LAPPGGTEVGICGAGQARRFDAIRSGRDGDRGGERDIRGTGGYPTRDAELALYRGGNRARNPAKVKRLEHVEGGSDVITQLLSSKSKSSTAKYRSSFFASFFLRRSLLGMDIGAAMQQAIAKLNIRSSQFLSRCVASSLLSITCHVSPRNGHSGRFAPDTRDAPARSNDGCHESRAMPRLSKHGHSSVVCARKTVVKSNRPPSFGRGARKAL